MILKNPIDRINADGLIKFLDFNFKTVQEKVEKLSKTTNELKLNENRKYFVLFILIEIRIILLLILIANQQK